MKLLALTFTASLSLLGACLSVPEGPAPMCHTTDDCDGGEVCDEGVCWGDPPMGPFAAIVSPPSERGTDLAPREIQSISITSDGWIEDLELETPLIYGAELACVPLTCNAAELSATITVTRPSTIPGGPAFRSVVTAEGTDPFQLAVPRTGDGMFTVLVMPDGRDVQDTDVTPAQLVPPARLLLSFSDSLTDQQVMMGSTGPTISGMVRTDTNAPLAGYRVVALGRWDALSAPVEVSTVDYTSSTGTYSIQLADGLIGNVEVVAKPIEMMPRPTLHLAGLRATEVATAANLAWPAGVGEPRTIHVPVESVDGNGELVDVSGVRVIVKSTVVTSNSSRATFTAETMTDANGMAMLDVLGGAAFAEGYTISIVPPPSAAMGVLFENELSLVAPIPKLRLPGRIALRGVVYDFEGNPVKDVSVTARPSLKFVWSLEGASQAFLTTIPPASATTPETGEFVVWVDHNIANIWGHYDLVVEPTSTSRAPSAVYSNIELPREATQTTVTLPVLQLPDPAFVRGHVYDDQDQVLEGAELKLYAIEDQSLCGIVKYPPMTCAIPARLTSRGAADDEGQVRLTLPRP